MNIAKIKAALKKNPKTEFVYATYSGTPSARHSRIIEIVSTTPYDYNDFRGYSDRALDPTEVSRLQATQGTGGTTGYYLLVKMLSNPLDPSQTEDYIMTKAAHIKGFYADYEQMWAKDKVLLGKLAQLQNRKNRIIAEQTTQVKTKEELTKRSLYEMLLDIGLTQQEIMNLDIRADISIRFQRKDYPELEHFADQFRDDLDNHQLEVSYRVKEVELRHFQAFMEVIQQLRQSNLELAKELEREKRLNVTR
jgi:hypothetical protein